MWVRRVKSEKACGGRGPLSRFLAGLGQCRIGLGSTLGLGWNQIRADKSRSIAMSLSGRGIGFLGLVAGALLASVFAYELFVASQLITGLVYGAASSEREAVIACVLFGASLAYSLYGGVNAVFRTDHVQLIGIVLFVVILAKNGVDSPI